MRKLLGSQVVYTFVTKGAGGLNIRDYSQGRKTLMLGKMEGRRRGRQRMRWVGGIADSMDMRLSKFQESVMDGESLACCGPRGCTESGLSELTIKGK